VPEVWLIDLQKNVVEVYRQPGPDGYGTIRRHRAGDALTPSLLPEIVLAVSDLLP
jgi:Uma2 family endonuclease